MMVRDKSWVFKVKYDQTRLVDTEEKKHKS